MPTNVTAVDKRAPVEPPPPPTLLERIPLGSFVAYNGPSTDGERKRAVVIDHVDDAIVVIDGAERVTVAGDELATVIVLAKSADAYANRVSVKARTLAKANGWCGTAEDAITELNTTPEGDDSQTRRTVYVEVVSTSRFALLPTNRSQRSDHDILEQLKDRYYGATEFNYDWFRNNEDPVVDVAIALVDPVVTEEATTAKAPARSRR